MTKIVAVAGKGGVGKTSLAGAFVGGRVPTLLVLQKYAGALGKHIELKVCDNME